MSEERQLVAILDPVLELSQAHGVESIKDLDGAWEIAIDDHWYLAVNGHEEPVTVEPDGMMEVELEPFCFCVWYNGWVAGIFTPFEGEFAAGEAANEHTFVEAIRAHIERMEGGNLEDPEP